MDVSLETRGGFQVIVFKNGGFRGATPAEIELFTLIGKIKGALNTKENDDALIEVARNACKAEMELASLHREYDDGDQDQGLRGTGERGS